MISISQVYKFYGKKDLFKGAGLTIRPGDRIGLVGPNGAGKSTLFKLLLGEETPDQGTVSKPDHIRLGFLPQDVLIFSGKTVLGQTMNVEKEVTEIKTELADIQKALSRGGEDDLIMSLAHRQAELLEEFDRLGGYNLESRAKKMLLGLGFKEKDFDRPVDTLSGGWMMRVALARILLSEPDVLLLDEPTNHLDLESLIWFEQTITAMRSALVVVSHDREFLNKVVQRIAAIDNGQLIIYNGNYDYYETEKDKRILLKLADWKAQQDEIRRVNLFIDKNRTRKDRARQVQARIRSLEKMEKIEPPQSTKSISFSFPEPPRSGKVVLELKDVAKTYDGPPVYEHLDFAVYRGDRLALVGPNGAGKTTLMKLLAGVIEPDRGERKVGFDVQLAYFSQHQWDLLTPNHTVLEEISQCAGNHTIGSIRNMLGCFLFSGDEVHKKVSVLSGGEKSRLVFMKMLLSPNNVLLLDEPTNHLDIPSREVMEAALDKYTGTIVCISHDRRFINRICNQVLHVKDGRTELFEGNYNDFISLWQKSVEAEPVAAVKSEPTETPVNDIDSRKSKKDKDQKRREAELRQARHQAVGPLKVHLSEVEALIDETTKAFDRINRQMTDPATYLDGRKARDVQEEHRRLKDHLARLTAEWEDLAMELEEREQDFQDAS
ncbi:MAG: ABC-F family ATP-binding cassette domain-containing protein [Deltaproteobacteria bacterium]|nr:ABC-F family ATP-binding cassette domain-containing protein [Deltaproteobacteria bacterium]